MSRRSIAVLSALAALVLPAGSVHAQDASPSAPASPVPGATIALPDGWQPEGITSDGDTLYVGSLADGAIWRGSASAGIGDVFIEGQDEMRAVGVEYESAAGRLWVAGGRTGEVRVYDGATGEQLGAWQATTPGETFLNDLVATPGAVYVTDSMAAELIVIPLAEDGSLPAADAAARLPLTGDYEQVEGFNANGIVAVGDQLILVQAGKLFRVDPTSGQASAIDAGEYSFGNGDGLELAPPGLFVVQNGLNLVALVTLDEALETASLVGEITSPDLDVPTTAAWSGDRLYAVNARFNTDPGPDVRYWITALSPPESSRSPAPAPS
jgi:sugar lactone lactonase YvrE